MSSPQASAPEVPSTCPLLTSPQTWSQHRPSVTSPNPRWRQTHSLSLQASPSPAHHAHRPFLGLPPHDPPYPSSPSPHTHPPPAPAAGTHSTRLRAFAHAIPLPGTPLFHVHPPPALLSPQIPVSIKQRLPDSQPPTASIWPTQPTHPSTPTTIRIASPGTRWKLAESQCGSAGRTWWAQHRSQDRRGLYSEATP